MMSRQKELARFPVPPLREALHSYLDFLRPLLTSDAMKAAEEVVNEFAKADGEGERLHKLLEDRASATDNWLSNWWMEEMFLKPRVPLPWYSSPALAFPREKFNTKQDQLRHAALLVAGALDMKYRIDRRILQPEVTRDGPLDMSQYPKLFNTYQVPCRGRDALEIYSATDESSRKVVVIHNNQFFVFSGHDARGAPYDERRVLAHLQRVVDMSQKEAIPIGILTTQDRDTWAEAYERLCQKDGENEYNKHTMAHALKMRVRRIFVHYGGGTGPKNAACVEAIKKAALVVCLDQALDTSEPYEVACAQQIFLGGSGGENAGNRWADKTLQFVVGREGHAGILFVHSPMDSSLVAALLDHCYEYMKSRRDCDPSVVVEMPTRLEFELSPETLKDIDNAKHSHARVRDDMDQVFFKFADYGKDFIKSRGMSPDSYVQMALQLAYYKMNKTPGLLHESISLRHFLRGRTEGVRGSSTESLSFCEVFEGSCSSMKEKETSLRRAVTKHKRDVILAASGHGVDRLLFGLRLIASQNGIPLPALFEHPAFQLAKKFRIKTTQVSTRCDGVMMLGPVVPDGYFVLYNVRPFSLNFGVSSFRSCPTTSAVEFSNALKAGLTQMSDCLLYSQVQTA